jgi:DNA polymerase/3'-5' exonuclease PolX
MSQTRTREQEDAIASHQTTVLVPGITGSIRRERRLSEEIEKLISKAHTKLSKLNELFMVRY